jgi:hypothetical protein
MGFLGESKVCSLLVEVIAGHHHARSHPLHKKVTPVIPQRLESLFGEAFARSKRV